MPACLTTSPAARCADALFAAQNFACFTLLYANMLVQQLGVLNESLLPDLLMQHKHPGLEADYIIGQEVCPALPLWLSLVSVA